jgi:hypothetical protein
MTNLDELVEKGCIVSDDHFYVCGSLDGTLKPFILLNKDNALHWAQMDPGKYYAIEVQMKELETINEYNRIRGEIDETSL